MNKIISALLNDYQSNQEDCIKSLPLESAFEHYAAFLTVGPLTNDTVDTTTIALGEDGQPSVDAIATIINGALLTEPDDIDTYLELNKYLDVDFVFVQAKTSPSFSVDVLGSLGDFVERVFTDGSAAVDNQRVQDFVKLKDAIYKKVKHFTRRNPNVHLYYVATGNVPEVDKHFELKSDRLKKQLKNLNIFNDVKIDCIGAAQLQKLDRQMSSALSRTITFQRRVPLPKIPHVDQSYLGALPAKEFLSLLSNENDNLLQAIFYDNVRDWQGLNDVNSGIKSTLESPAEKARFVLMNNGVTIIARKILESGDTLVVDDYQIVNGCQTSHVLWQCRESLDDAVLVPLRLIATSDEAVVRGIIQATNSQTEVSQSQLLAVSDFQKQLEIFFSAQTSLPLFYERRSRQFSGKPVEKTKIVSPVTLIKAFASMFLAEPHRTSRDFASTLKRVGTDIFAKDHKHEPYYLAALTLYWVLYLIRNGKIPKELLIARFHILLAVRLLLEKAPPEQMTSKKIQKYSTEMAKRFSDAASAETAMKQAVHFVSRLAKKHKYSRDVIRSAAFTTELVTLVKTKKSVLTRGKVMD